MNFDKIKNFAKDKAVEENVSKFLDENFYSQISANVEIFARTTDRDSQVRGVDLSVGNFLVDEKVKNCRNSNQMNNYWASVEFYQKFKTGEYKLGWFVDPENQTTHYAYIYKFQDENGEISSVIMVWFKKSDLKEMINSQVSVDKIIEDGKNMEFARKGMDDVRYYNDEGKYLFKLTKTYENATVLTTTLEQICSLKSTRVFKISKGRKIKKLSFDDMRNFFT